MHRGEMRKKGQCSVFSKKAVFIPFKGLSYSESVLLWEKKNGDNTVVSLRLLGKIHWQPCPPNFWKCYWSMKSKSLGTTAYM